MVGQGGGAPTWSVAILWVCWSWSFPGGASQGQSPTVLSRAILPELSKKVVLVLGVEIASRTQAVNLGWLLLLPGLGLTEASCCLFERI